MSRSVWLLLILTFSGCNWPYAEFSNGEREVYVCGQDGIGIITAQPCSERSSDHLEFRGDGAGIDMAVFADLCDGYSVTAFGRIEVIGDPPFDFDISGSWRQFGQRKDSLELVHSGSDCRGHYYLY